MDWCEMQTDPWGRNDRTWKGLGFGSESYSYGHMIVKCVEIQDDLSLYPDLEAYRTKKARITETLSKLTNEEADLLREHFQN